MSGLAFDPRQIALLLLAACLLLSGGCGERGAAPDVAAVQTGAGEGTGESVPTVDPEEEDTRDETDAPEPEDDPAPVAREDDMPLAERDKPRLPDGWYPFSEDPEHDEEREEVEALLTEKKWKTFIVRFDFSDASHPARLLQLRDGLLFKGGPLTEEESRTLATSRTIRYLSLDPSFVDAASLEILVTMPSLRGLKIKGDNVTDDVLEVVAGCGHLEHVALERVPNITDAGLAGLANCPLKTLHVDRCQCDGTGFTAFRKHPTLTVVKFVEAPRFTDEGAACLGRIPNLISLDIRSIGTIPLLTPAGIEQIIRTRLPRQFYVSPEVINDDVLTLLISNDWLPGNRIGRPPQSPLQITDLVLADSPVTDKGLGACWRFRNLEAVRAQNSGLGDKAPAILAQFPKLKELRLSSTDINGSALHALAGSPIEELWFDGNTLTEEHFKAFAKLPRLSRLYLQNCTIEEDGLEHLSGAKWLELLKLNGTPCTPETFRQLATISALRDISLVDTGLDDETFGLLLALPNLKSVNVSRGTLTSKSYAAAGQREPPVNVRRIGSLRGFGFGP